MKAGADPLKPLLLLPLPLAGEGWGEGGRCNKPKLYACGPTLTQPSPASGRGLHTGRGFGSLAPALLLLAAVALVAGCKRENMYAQRYVRTWNQHGFFSNGLAMRHPPEGTVARTPYQAVVPAPAVITAVLLERGHERFSIFCTPCHGRTGNGDGMIVQRGFPKPPSFVEGSLRTADNKVFYDAITRGYGAMYPFDTRVSPADRWAIISYIRALQRSQNTAVANLPPAMQTELDAAK